MIENHQRPEAIIWGAGKIGRGFLAEVFADAGYHLDFVEYEQKLVEKLDQVDKYTIFKVISSTEKKKTVINDFKIYHTEEIEKITQLIAKKNSIIAIAVHQSALPAVAKTLAAGIKRKVNHEQDSTLDIILCVNMSDPADYFKEVLKEKLSPELYPYLDKIGFINSVVMRISPELTAELKAQDPLAVLNNGYPEMPVDKTAFKGNIPETDLLRPTEIIEAEEKRKIYTLNMAHVLLAFLGSTRGYQYAAEAVMDSDIRKVVTDALAEAGQGLAAEYDFTEEEMKQWNQEIINMLENPALRDRLDRLGRDSRRKLRKTDRLVGPALLALKAGIVPFNLAQGIAYGFKFQSDDPGTQAVQTYLSNNGIEAAIEQFCGLESEHQLARLIKKIYKTQEVI